MASARRRRRVTGARVARAAAAILLALGTALTLVQVHGAAPALAATPLSFATACANPTETITTTVTDDVTLNKHDTVLIAAGGAFLGGFHAFNAGAVVCVAAGGQLRPAYANKIAGSIYNQGITALPSFSAHSGFLLVNEAALTFDGNANVKGTAQLLNTSTGTVTLSQSANLGGGALITNEGTMTLPFGGSVNSGATVVNSGTLTSGRALSVTGTLTNTGLLSVTGDLTESVGAVFDNQCVIRSSGPNRNDSTAFDNAGLVRTGGAFTNNGRYRENATGLTVGASLSNVGTLTGFGAYLFSGNTTTAGVFVGDTPNAPIVVDDRSPTGPIFDTANGSVGNVARGAVADPGDALIYPGCTNVEPAADVVTSKTGPASVTAGAPVTYTVVVHDAGTGDAAGVVVTDVVTGGLTGITASNGGLVSGSAATGWTVTWSLGALTNGQTVTLTVAGQTPSSGTVIDAVSSTATTPDPEPANNNGTSPTASVSTLVEPAAPVNNAPTVPDQELSTLTGTPVSASTGALDPDDGQVVTSALDTQAAHGTALVDPGGPMTYTPVEGFTGIDSFTLQACDNGTPVKCDLGTVTVLVVPLANPDTATTEQDTPVAIEVALNDLGTATRPVVSGPPAHGSVTGPDLQGVLTYTPAAGFTGTDAFSYRICSPTTSNVCDSAVVSVTVTAPPNHPPEVTPASLTTTATVPVTREATATDPDPGQTLTFKAGGQPPAHGTVAVTAGGTVTYTPGGTFTGTDTFSVAACDDATPSLCSEANFVVVVSPHPSPDTATTAENTAVDIDLTANDVGSATTPTVVPSSGPTNGQVTILGNGTARYTPDLGFSGTDTFQYRVCSTDRTACATATVSVFVAAAPELVLDGTTLQTVAETPVSGFVTASEPADTLTFSVETAPAHGGSFDVTTAGQVSYQPPNGFSGRDSATVRACRTLVPTQCDTAEVLLEVTPLANPDTATTEQDTPVAIDVALNDLGTATRPVVSGPPAHGSVTGPDLQGVLTYTPAAGFTGTDAFSYTICSPTTSNVCDSAVVSVTVTAPPNHPPEVTPASLTTTATVPVTREATATDPDPGQTLTFRAGGQPPAHGTVAVTAGGTVTYTPGGTFTGTDTFSVAACDDATPSLCSEANFVVVVSPHPSPDTATTAENTAVDIDLTGNDVGSATTPTVVPSAGPTNGQVTILGNGAARYTPDLGFSGTDTFQYRVCSADRTACATATVSVFVAAAPELVLDGTTLQTVAETPVSGFVTASEPADTLTFSVETAPAHGGSFDVTTAGQVSYQPPNGFSGRDSATVRACRTLVPTQCDTAEVLLEVTPLANPDTATTERDTPVAIDVAVNDLGTATRPVVSAPPAHGSVTGPDLQGVLTYTPAAGFTGTDAFSYTICSPTTSNVCDSAVVSVTVTAPPNHPPEVTPASLTTTATVPVTRDATATDPDPGQTLTFRAGGLPPAHGTAAVTAGGTVTYTPGGTFTGTDTFSVAACDDATPSLCSEANFVVVVSPHPSPDTATTAENTAVDIDLTGNDVGSATTPTVVPSSGPTNGQVTILGNGAARYTPDLGFSGTDTFQYRVCSADRTACATATVSVFVAAAPELVLDGTTLQTVAETPVSGFVTASEPADTLTFSVETAPAHGGSFDVTTAGQVSYQPPNGFSGRDSATVRACRTLVPTQCDTAEVLLEVTPLAVADGVDTVAHETAVVDVRANDVGATGTITVPVQPPHGTASVDAATGEITYTPTEDFTGYDHLTYRACAPAPDGDLCAPGLLTVRVFPEADADLAETLATAPVTIAIKANDLGSTGAPTLAEPAHGATTITGDSVVYTPPGQSTGYDSFAYLVCSLPASTDQPDDTPLCSEAPVTVAVNPDPNHDAATTVESTPVAIPVTANDLGESGPPLLPNGTTARSATVATGTGPPFGAAVVLPDGQIQYTPTAGFTGIDSFTYLRCSVNAPELCDSATVVVLVTPQVVVTQPPLTPTPTPTSLPTSAPAPTGPASSTPTPAPSTAGGSPSPTRSTTHPPSPSAQPGAGGASVSPSPTAGSLAFTGADTSGPLVAGLVLVAGGSVLIVVSLLLRTPSVPTRRRHPSGPA